MEEIALELKNLNKQFKNQSILSDFSCKIPQNKIVALIGRNGAGKTTLLKLLAGNEELDSGGIIYQGIRLKTTEDRFQKILFLGDEKILVPELSGEEHLLLFANPQMKERQEKLIAYFAMESFLKKKVREYSLGMRQLLLILLSIVSISEVLLFDEVLNGLDTLNAKKVLNVLGQLKREKLIIISSHQLQELQEKSDYVLFFHKEKLELFKNTQGLSLKELLLESMGGFDETDFQL